MFSQCNSSAKEKWNQAVERSKGSPNAHSSGPAHDQWAMVMAVAMPGQEAVRTSTDPSPLGSGSLVEWKEGHNILGLTREREPRRGAFAVGRRTFTKELGL